MNFFDATSSVFKNWQEYLKLFLLELGLGILMGIVSIVPIIGFIGVILLTYYLFFFLPVGVYSIMKDETLDIKKVLQDTYDACLHPGKAIGQIGKIILVIFVLGFILTVFVLFATLVLFGTLGMGIASLYSNEMMFSHFNIIEYFLLFLIIMVVVLLSSVVLAKMQMTLYYKILSQLLGDANYTYLETHKSLFTYDFIWTLIPIISLFAPYSLTTRFIHLYDEEKQKENIAL